MLDEVKNRTHQEREREGGREGERERGDGREGERERVREGGGERGTSQGNSIQSLMTKK